MEALADTVDEGRCCKKENCPRRKLERLGIDPFINGLTRDYILSRATLEELWVPSHCFWKLLSKFQEESCDIYAFLLLRMRCLLGDAQRIMTHPDFFSLIDDGRFRREILIMVLQFYRGMCPATETCRICDSPILLMYHERDIYHKEILRFLDFMTTQQIQRTLETLHVLSRDGLNPLHANYTYCCRKHLNYFSMMLSRDDKNFINFLIEYLQIYLKEDDKNPEKRVIHELLYRVKGDVRLLKNEFSDYDYKKIEHLFHPEEHFPYLTGDKDLKICCRVLKCLQWTRLNLPENALDAGQSQN